MKGPHTNERSCRIWITCYQVSQSVLADLFYFASMGTVELLIPFIDRVLEPHGGRLLEGWMEVSGIFY
jgi:hypothetical protein